MYKINKPLKRKLETEASLQKSKLYKTHFTFSDKKNTRSSSELRSKPVKGKLLMGEDKKEKVQNFSVLNMRELIK